MFDAIRKSTIAFEEYLASSSDRTVILYFSSCTKERPFNESDAILAHAIANLPERGRLPIAVIAGELTGAELALALFCPLILMGRSAQISTGFGRPGSSAIYVAAARHVGAVKCERLLFSAARVTPEMASEAYLATAINQASEELSFPANRLATMTSVAKANLVTWPVSLTKTMGLVDAT